MGQTSIVHDLKRDFHNLFTLLNFIKEDSSILDIELNEMLEANLAKYSEIEENLKKLSAIVRDSTK